MPANEKLPISKARLLRLFKDAQRIFCLRKCLEPEVSSGGWMSETDLSKESLFNLVSLNSVVRLKAFEVSLLLGLLKANLFLKIL